MIQSLDKFHQCDIFQAKFEVFLQHSATPTHPPPSGYYAGEVRLVDYDVFREVLSAVMKP